MDVVTVPSDDVAPTFESFFAADYEQVVGLAFVLCGRRVVAEEVAQDAFVQAYRRWSMVSGYDDPGAYARAFFDAWVATIDLHPEAAAEP